jgi:hypothetical protein
MSRILHTALLILVASCGSPQLQAPIGVASSRPTELPLRFAPSYASSVAGNDGVYLYLETETDDGHEVFALHVDVLGNPTTSLERLFRMEEPFGDITTSEDALIVSVLNGHLRNRRLEIWRWLPPEPVTLLLDCALEGAVDGQVLVDRSELFVVYESEEGALRAFRTSIMNPGCPNAREVVTLMEAPLPKSYLVDWLDGRLVVGGQAGETFVLHFFGRDLELTQRSRLAVGSATSARDLTIASIASLGATVVYSSERNGTRDLFLASLDGLNAGPLEGRRIVASAESESNPRLIARGELSVVSWSVFEPHRGEQLTMAGILLAGDELSGGEIVWRLDTQAYPTSASTWAAAGLVRFWADATAIGGRLFISLYEPSFWNRL